MRLRNWPLNLLYRSVLICFCYWLIGPCAKYAQPQNSSTEADKNSNYLSKVHQGDLIDIHVKGFVDYDWRGRLNPEGFLDGFDKITDSIYGQCKTVQDIAAAIDKSLAPVIRDPNTEVRIVDTSRRAYAVIDGAIKNPQRFQIRRPIRLNELIIQAGGFTDRSSGEILVSRPSGSSCFQDQDGIPANVISLRIADVLAGRLKTNPMIVSGDLVVISEALPVYLLGAVVTQGKLDFRTDLTVSRAIDSAGGTTKQAVLERINIYRRDGVPSLVSVDLEKVRKNEVEDVKLRPFDIIDVPFKGRPPKRMPPVLEELETAKERQTKLPVKIIE